MSISKKYQKQIVLIVLDGWGYREEKKIMPSPKRNTPFDSLWSDYPHALLEASGLAVESAERADGQ